MHKARDDQISLSMTSLNTVVLYMCRGSLYQNIDRGPVYPMYRRGAGVGIVLLANLL